METTWNERINLAPAIIAALVLHLAFFLAITLLDRRPWPMPGGSAVPIELVSSGPPKPAAQAQVAPQTQQAAAEVPAPQPPQTVPAPPAPEPKPAATKTEAPARVIPKPAPTPSRPQPTRAFSLDALAASIAKAARSTPAKPAAVAQRGPNRPQTAPQAVVQTGEGVTQSDMEGLQQLLGRLWNPNCAVEGAGAVVIPVKFLVGPSGRVIGRVTASEISSSDPVIAAAARRAIDAVHEAEPFPEVFRNNPFTVNFDARKYCAER
jgi:outer membrane biosynthesis protein TonB